MSSSPYKRPILPAGLSDLKTRKGTYIAGKAGNHYKAAVRNPAFCYVSWPTGRVPEGGDEWYITYRTSKFRKPGPTLESLSVKLGVNGNNAFTNELEFKVKVYTKDDFSTVVKNLCKRGNLINVNFGYILPHAGGYNGKELTNYKLAQYTFDMSSDGTYTVHCTAYPPGVGTQGLNVNFRVETKNRFYQVGGTKYPVTGIAELIAYWAQNNGTKSIDDMTDGEVLIPPPGTKTDGNQQNMGALVIYESDHLNSKTSIFGGGGGSTDSDNTNEVSKSNNIVYVSLETLVGIINSEILPVYYQTTSSADGAVASCDFAQISIEFDGDLSYSWIDPEIRSAYPTKVLLLDSKLGNYENVNGNGKDFWKPLTNQEAVKCATLEGVNKIDYKKILIERTVILDCLKSAQIPPDPASTIDTRVNKEASVDIKAFLTKIFEVIKEATGDRISLTAGMHPDASSHLDESKLYKLYIFDETNGYVNNEFPVWVFDPIDGDGVTRVCTVKGDVGGENFKNQMYYGAHGTGGDALARAEGVHAAIEGAKAIQRSIALDQIKQIIYDPGALGDSAFDETHMQSLKGQYVSLKDYEPDKVRYQNLPFVGLGIDVEIDGLWGIGPGAGIWTSQMPDEYEQGHVYFNVVSVTHEFDPQSSDWSTKIEGMLNTVDKVDYMKG